MPIESFPPVGQSECCYILPGGQIHIPSHVLERTPWHAGDQGDSIAVSYLADEGLLVLLLAKAEAGRAGFKLHYLNRNGLTGSGGILRCTRLATRILSPRIALPMRDIAPVFFEQDKSTYSWQLALMLQLPAWIDIEFSQAAAETVPPRSNGVYMLTTSDRRVYRYGCGQLQVRMREHLKSSDHTRTARRFCYFPLVERSDALLMEHLFLLRHKQMNNGQLPPGNRITA